MSFLSKSFFLPKTPLKGLVTQAYFSYIFIILFTEDLLIYNVLAIYMIEQLSAYRYTTLHRKSSLCLKINGIKKESIVAIITKCKIELL
jgi:hypothetical protein